MQIKILTREDFSRYDYNRPSDKWELVEYTLDGVSETWWTPKSLLERELSE